MKSEFDSFLKYLSIHISVKSNCEVMFDRRMHFLQKSVIVYKVYQHVYL